MEIQRFRPVRTIVQVLGLLALVVVPAAGLFRIDFAQAHLLLLGRQVGMRDFAVIAGLAIIVAAAPLLTYSTVGTIWCGWACPQNTLSEWADRLTHRMLGSRANVNVEGVGLQVAPSRNRIANWALLLASLLGASLLLGSIPLFWFIAPGELRDLVAGSADPRFARFMAHLYLVFVVAVIVDVAVLRHFWCDYLCLYRFGMLLFRSDAGLHVHYDASRASECGKCRACAVACVTRIEPTRIGRFDRCIDCGECVDACEALHARRGAGPGLLSFRVGADHRRQRAGEFARRAAGRLGIPGMVTAGGVLVLAWGLLHGAR